MTSLRALIGTRAGTVLRLATLLLGLTACERPSVPRDTWANTQFARIDSLRARGRFDEALRVDRALVAAAEDGSLRPWQAADAERLRADLVRILALPAEGRADVAAADRLTPEIERHLTAEEDYVAAVGDATRQLELRQRWLGPVHLDVAASLELLGRITNRFGENAQCAEYLARALALRRAALGPRHPLVAETLEQWGLSLKARSRTPLGYEAERQAVDILEATCGPDDLRLASALESLGSLSRLYLHLRSPDTAVEYYRRALAIRCRRGGPHSAAVAENLTWQAYALMFAHREQEADRVLAQAERILDDLGMQHSNDMGDVLFNRAMIAWLQEQHGRADSLWSRSDACQTFVSERMPQGFGLNRLGGVVGEWVDARLRSGHSDEAFAMICRDGGPVTRAVLNLSGARARWPGDAARLDSLRSAAKALREAVGSSGSPPDTLADPRHDGASQDEVAMAGLRLRLAVTDVERTRLEQALSARLAALPEGGPVTPAAVQAQLGPDQVMVGWVVARWRFSFPVRSVVWGYVIRHTGPVRWVCLEQKRWNTQRELDHWSVSAARAQHILEGADRWPQRVPPDPELNAALADDYQRYFRPLLPDLNGVHELVVVEALTTIGRPPVLKPEYFVDEHGCWLADRIAVTYVPSPEAFVRLGRSRAAASGPSLSLVAVADPRGPSAGAAEDRARAARQGPGGRTTIPPALFRSALDGDPEALRRLPALPEARLEVRRIGALYPGARLLIGPQATPAAFDSAVAGHGRIGVLHMATHALVDSRFPERSLLVLSPAPPADTRPGGRAVAGSNGVREQSAGTLTADQIMLGEQIDVDLVVLSACQTLDGMPSRGGEELGFAQAFLSAGARCLLLSRWKVDDHATAMLMGRFYENLTGRRAGARRQVPMSPAFALREAECWLRDWRAADGSTPFAHPIYWAGFEVLGAASAGRLR